MGNDYQCNAFRITINNPQDHNMNHAEIKKILTTEFSTTRFFCMADEIGAIGETPHTHVYIYFNSRVRFSMLKRYFPCAHIDKANRTINENINYVKKAGKWTGTEKAKTSIPGTYEEWGTYPKQKGKRGDMEELFQLVEAGYPTDEIIRLNNDYIPYIDKINKLRTLLLIAKYKNK